MTPALAETARSVLLPLRPTEAVDDDRQVVEAVRVVDKVETEPELREPVELVAFAPVVVLVVVQPLVQLAVDKADTTVDCCPSEFLVAFR